MAKVTGMKIGKPPKAGVDNRPWEVYLIDNPGPWVIRCWFEKTADEYIKIVGKKAYAKRHRWPDAAKRKKSPAAKKIAVKR